MGSIAAIAASHRVKAGKRYVFFQSLQNYDSWWYPQLYQQGQAYVSEAEAMLSMKNNNSIEDLSKLDAYVQMIGLAAENARAVEIKFFDTVKDMVKDNDELKNKINTFLTNYNNNANFNYLQFISLLNDIMLENNKLNQQIHERYMQNLELYNQAYEQADDLIQEMISESYQNFTKNDKGALIYASELNQRLREAADPNDDKTKIITQATSIFSNAVNKAINALLSNNELESQLIAQFLGAGIDEDNIISTILNAITLTVFQTDDLDNLIKTNGETIIKQVIENINKTEFKLTDLMSDSIINSFTQKMSKFRSFEDLALTAGGRGIGAQYKSLDENSKNILKKMYGIEELDENKFKSNRSNLAYITKQITAKIKEKYQDFDLEKELKEILIKDATKTRREALKEIREKINSTVKQLPAQQLKSGLSVKMTSHSMSELMLQLNNQIFSQLMNNPENVIRIKLGQIQLKTDAIIGVFSDKVVPILTESEDRQKLFEILSQSSVNFLKKYKAESGGEIDVSAAHKAFLEEQRATRENVTDFLQKLEMKHEDINKTINSLQEYINQSISVKDYSIYLNKEGFHAQSLGATSEKTIDNIINMYELGGISNIDRDLLLFAVNNCAPETIGSHLKNDLATFLLGGAALMTFDQGFVLLEKYIENYKNDILTSQMLLYKLESKFIPASYILTSVYNNLLHFYYEVETEMFNVSKNANQVHIINNINEKYVPDWEFMPKAQDRWNYVRDQAASVVKIKMSFMAGLLDIFEQLPNAFN